jgi:hypothetical protein
MTLIIQKSTSRALREGRLSNRKGPPRGIVIHTTGSGPFTRFNKNPDKFESPFAAAQYIYERISKYSGHYLISGDDGSTVNLVDPMTVAWHVGKAGSWRYKYPSWSKGKCLGWWTTRFPGCTSPRDLLDGHLWREGSANDLCIGIEVSPPSSGPRDAWRPQTWDSLRCLSENLCNRFGIAKDRYHILTHSDVHPLARITKAGSPWDPSPGQWLISKASEELNLH